MRAMKRRNQHKSVTIRGVVALAEWSDSRDEADVVILTDSEDEFYVDASETAMRPAKFVNSRVEASGKLYENEDRWILAVKRMRVIDSIHDFDDYDLEDDSDEFDDSFDDDGGIHGLGDIDDYGEYARLIRGNNF